MSRPHIELLKSGGKWAENCTMISYHALHSRIEYYTLLLGTVTFGIETAPENADISRKNTDDIHFLGLALERIIREVINDNFLIGKHSLLEELLKTEREFCDLLEKIGLYPAKYAVTPESFMLYYHSLLKTHIEIALEIQALLRNSTSSKGGRKEDFVSPEEFRSLLMSDLSN